ncbi:hypothetical protein M413DRAFT_443387 [Hebeloma cylindrosporum]|uniref:Uncharacterized protein n=1 Tax=Hebeloma cylindrosporum TaxID=76867 RepID=A0A0C2Y0Q1_HEBCY|nr:hypothetical protein M413DRAFT_443387 [Hebeloma cylindrosporum h7]
MTHTTAPRNLPGFECSALFGQSRAPIYGPPGGTPFPVPKGENALWSPTTMHIPAVPTYWDGEDDGADGLHPMTEENTRLNAAVRKGVVNMPSGSRTHTKKKRRRSKR